MRCFGKKYPNFQNTFMILKIFQEHMHRKKQATCTFDSQNWVSQFNFFTKKEHKILNVFCRAWPDLHIACQVFVHNTFADRVA